MVCAVFATAVCFESIPACNDNLEHKTEAQRKDRKKKLMKKRDRWPRRIVD